MSAAGSPVLYFNIDCKSGSEVDGEVVFENRDLCDQAFDQRLVKLRDRGRLALDEVLQVKTYGLHLLDE